MGPKKFLITCLCPFVNLLGLFLVAIYGGSLEDFSDAFLASKSFWIRMARGGSTFDKTFVITYPN